MHIATESFLITLLDWPAYTVQTFIIKKEHVLNIYFSNSAPNRRTIVKKVLSKMIRSNIDKIKAAFKQFISQTLSSNSD